MTRLRLLTKQLARAERGFTLIEVLTTLLILGVVMGGLSTVFASAINAEADMNNRYRAQHSARSALDKIRREVHCASTASPAGSNTSSITLKLPT
jgi:prepilin-type N-terminal cleavage/methylation domain-containing protein